VTSTSASPVGEVPAAKPPPKSGIWSRHATTLAFVAPAFVLLAIFYLYPTVYTVWRSLISNDGKSFVWLDNYKALFTDDVLFRAIRNSAVWVAIVPATVTALGLVFAVLVEKIRWATAFKFAMFAPLAISLFAAGVIWRAAMYNKDPDRGTINATIAVARDAVKPSGVLSSADPSSNAVASENGTLGTAKPVSVGGTALLGVTAIPPDEVPADAKQAAQPQRISGGISGVVWRDFKPGGGQPGKVEQGEDGLPGVKLELRDTNGKTVETADSGDDGTFKFEGVPSGQYDVDIAKESFQKPFAGVSWLGPKLITPAMIIAYLWTAAGFALVVIGAGLAALPRDVLEAARTDGASEFQVFRRVTVPLLRPVLLVVFVTQLIGVLKVFDIILAIAPGSVWDNATVLAFEMWRKSFQFQLFGVGSALAVFLFLLVIPIVLLNIRNFRREL
jgi:alpha-glucoside transport system permease protein